MGTPDFAVPCLERLAADGHELCGVFTRADKPKGRGYAMVPPPVKVTAQKLGIPVYQPPGLKDPAVAELIRSLAPEMIVVVAYGRLLPEAVLSIPPRGCVNVHASLLPKYRGAAPVQWAVINGEPVTGVATMFMSKGLDTGDIILTKQTSVGAEETAGQLFEHLKPLGAALLSETLRLAQQGELPRRAQNDALSSYAPQLQKTDGLLDFSQSAQTLHDRIRGLNPWPCAYTYLRGRVFKVHASRVAAGRLAEGLPGAVEDAGDEGIAVACGQGVLWLTGVQAEGGRRMPAVDYLRGHPIEKGTVLGGKPETAGA